MAMKIIRQTNARSSRVHYSDCLCQLRIDRIDGGILDRQTDAVAIGNTLDDDAHAQTRITLEKSGIRDRIENTHPCFSPRLASKILIVKSNSIHKRWLYSQPLNASIETEFSFQIQ